MVEVAWLAARTIEFAAMCAPKSRLTLLLRFITNDDFKVLSYRKR